MESLERMEDWNRVKEQSEKKPAYILKHSTACPVSASAFDTVQKAEENNGITSPVYIVVIQEHRNISKKIADDTGVKHESPQVICLYQKSAIYDADHYGINPEDLEKVAQKI